MDDRIGKSLMLRDPNLPLDTSLVFLGLYNSIEDLGLIAAGSNWALCSDGNQVSFGEMVSSCTVFISLLWPFVQENTEQVLGKKAD